MINSVLIVQKNFTYKVLGKAKRIDFDSIQNHAIYLKRMQFYQRGDSCWRYCVYSALRRPKSTQPW